jgi:hypothetical protein
MSICARAGDTQAVTELSCPAASIAATPNT